MNNLLTAEAPPVRRIEASRIVGRGFPTDEGEAFARYLCEQVPGGWEGIEIDLTDCDSRLLISAFFNSFLQAVYELKPERLEEARLIRWKLRFEFQRKNVGQWMKEFQPFVTK